MVKRFSKWFERIWEDLSEEPEIKFDYNKEWEYYTPFEYIQSKINLRGPSKDLELAHEVIINCIQESCLKPNNIVYTSEGEKRKINETIIDYQSLADDIRQELFSRNMAININEKLKNKEINIVTGPEPIFSNRYTGMLWNNGSKTFIWMGDLAEWKEI
jgi:hypothetical protein